MTQGTGTLAKLKINRKYIQKEDADIEMTQKYFVKLTESEQNRLQELINSRNASKSIKKRANILLMSDMSAGNPAKQAEIAKRCGVSVVTVYHTLRDFACNGLTYTLTYKRKKTTNPPIVTSEMQARIIALACSEPPKGFARWTVRMLTEKIIELGILEKVSRETVRQTLKKQNLSLI